MILVSYATLLIIVVICRRERLPNSSQLFNWKELFTRSNLNEPEDEDRQEGENDNRILPTAEVGDEQSK
jgi:hypothetical protein